MIIKETKEVEIEKSMEEYYDYLNTKYVEISAYLMKKDGFLDTKKLRLFVERATSPLVFWQEKRTPSQAPIPTVKEVEKTQYMKDLESKYGLTKKDGKYSLKAPLDTVKFRELAAKMKEAGYKWSSEKKGFIEVPK